MSLIDEAAAQLPQPRRTRSTHPEGWEPGAQWDGRTGTLTAKVERVDPQWDDLLHEWGFDPAEFEIVEPIQFRTWDAAIGGGEMARAYYYRATIRSRSDSVDLQVLIDEIKRHRPVKAKEATGGAALVVPWADWQLGADDYGGPEATVQRFLDSIGKVQDRWRDLNRIGVNLDRLVVAGLGDLGEGCKGWYAQQAYRVKLNEREQRRLVRRMILQGLKEWAPLAPRIVVPAVGGNHGENRDESNKSFTDFSDNRDVAVFEDAAEVLAENPDRYGHMSFVLPSRELDLALDVHGTIVGFAHGHQARTGGTSPVLKLQTWWKDQMKSLRPVGEADILVAGHFHQHAVQSFGPRWVVVAPALHGGSEWWDNTHGGGDQPGQLTFTVDGSPTPSNLAIL